jgi:ATP-dependent helicase HepA
VRLPDLPEVDTLPYAIGHKVWVSKNGYRFLGEIYQVPVAGRAKVAFTRGPGKSEVRSVPCSWVELAELPSQLRVLVHNGTVWRYGRVVSELPARVAPLRTFHIRFPNRDREELNEDEFVVLAGSDPIDPIDSLAARACETPFFYEERAKFVKSLVRQRAVCRGLTGLISSRIDLYPHQVATVRRVLQDPRQRYLLADEVGLGKTIEAGIIIRQLLIDDPSLRVVVLTPLALVTQWQSELRTHFDLDFAISPHVPKSVMAYPGGMSLSEIPELLVVDEAHRLLKTPDSAVVRWLDEFAPKVPRLLLLTATPVLGHEAEFLHLLSWLEPAVYRVTPEDIDTFRRRVRQRQRIGRELLALAPDSEQLDGFPISLALSRLQGLFGGEEEDGFRDDSVLELCEQLTPLIDDGSSDIADPVIAGQVRRLLQKLRLHVSECYRLHRRLIRNRRHQQSIISAERREPNIAYELNDDRKQEIWRAFESWRAQVAFVLEDAPASQVQTMIDVFRMLVEAIGSWTPLAADLISVRLGHRPKLAIGTDEIPSIGSLRSPLVTGEADLLESLLAAIRTELPGEDRLQSLVKLANTWRTAMSEKVVVFTSFSRVAQELARRLEQVVPGRVNLLQAGQHGQACDTQIEQFERGDGFRLLISDRSGEEGRNLQFADRLVHFDLPLDPFSLEQRIGRLDRLHRRRKELKSVVLLCDNAGEGFDESWYRLMSEGFRVFTSPISDLHLYAEQAGPELLRKGLLQGRWAWEEAIPAVIEGICQERQNNREQDIFDSLDYDDESTGFFEGLQQYDQDGFHEFQNAVKDYLSRVNIIDTEAYLRASAEERAVFHARRKVLLRADWFNEIRQFLERPLGWKRGQVTLRESFLRLGHPLIDKLERFSREDDRGQAFLMWRECPRLLQPLLFSRINAVVEADLGLLRRRLHDLQLPPGRERELLRLADLFLPPMYLSHLVNEQGAAVVDPSHLASVNRPYSRHAGDRTLGNPKRAHLLDSPQYVGGDRWDVLCRRLREAAVPMIEQNRDYRAACVRGLSEVDRYFDRRLGQLRLNLMFADRAHRDAQVELEDRLYATMREAVQKPSIRIDAVGVYLLVGERCPCP